MATALAGQITYDQYGQPYDGWGNKIPGTLIPGGEGVAAKFIPTEGTIKQAGESGKDQYIPSRALTPAEQKIMAAGGQPAGGIKLDENGRMPDVGQGTLSGFWIMPNGSIAADPTQVDSHWGLRAGPNGYANFNGDWSKMVSLGSDLARAIHHGDDSFVGNVISPALKFAGIAGTLSGFGGKFLDSAANSLLGNATNGTGNLLRQFFSSGAGGESLLEGQGASDGPADLFSGMGSSETLTAEQLKALYQSMGMNPTDAAAAAASVFGEQGSSSLLDLLGKVPPLPPIPPKDNPEAPADGQAPPPPPPPPNTDTNYLNYLKSAASLFGGGPRTGADGMAKTANSGFPWSDLFSVGASTVPSVLAWNSFNNLEKPDTQSYKSLFAKAGDMSGPLGQYDINTGLGREQLTSSLNQRGVMGSSFGDQSLTNFNTQRDLGRGALSYSGIGTQGQLLNNMNTNIAQNNKNSTDFLGRTLGGIGTSIGTSTKIDPITGLPVSGGSSYSNLGNWLGNLFSGMGSGSTSKIDPTTDLSALDAWLNAGNNPYF